VRTVPRVRTVQVPKGAKGAKGFKGAKVPGVHARRSNSQRQLADSSCDDALLHRQPGQVARETARSPASLNDVSVATVATMHAPGKRASQGSVVIADWA